MNIEKKREIEALANRLMEEHIRFGLWSFSWNTRKTSFGLCRYAKQEIQLSICMMKGETMDAIEQTLLHEIAHAKAGHGAGHGYKWKAAALELGVRDPKGQRSPTAEESDRPSPSWVLVFGHEIVSKYYRRPGKRKMYCVHNLYAVGRKEQTLGYLRFMPWADYIREVDQDAKSASIVID